MQDLCSLPMHVLSRDDLRQLNSACEGYESEIHGGKPPAGSVTAECLRNWTGSTQQLYSVLALCLPPSQMQRVRPAHTRRTASHLYPADSKGLRHSWWEMVCSEIHSFSQPARAKSGFVIERKNPTPLYSICLSDFEGE